MPVVGVQNTVFSISVLIIVFEFSLIDLIQVLHKIFHCSGIDNEQISKLIHL